MWPLVLGKRRDELLGKRVLFGKGIAGWVAQCHEPVKLEGEVNDPRFAPLHPRTDIVSAVSMPMLAGGKLVGVLNANTTRRHTFTLGQVKGLNILVSTAAAALQGAMLFAHLQSAGQRYRSIFENAAEGIFQSTGDGRFILANPSLARIYGYGSPEELIAGVTDIASQLYVDPEQRTELKRQLDQQGSVAGFEVQFRGRDGAKIWVTINAARKFDEDRCLTYYEGAVEDITERKRAEDMLWENKAFLATLLNAIPVPVFYKDSEGRYLGFNRAFEEFFGNTSDQLIGKSVFDFNPMELAEVYHAKDAELLQDPGTQIYDSQVKDACGALHDVVIHKGTFMDSAGSVLGLIGAILDITERKQTEQALQESEDRFRLLVENAPDAIFVQTQGLFAFVNPSALKLLGAATKDQLTGSPVLERIHPSCHEIAEERMRFLKTEKRQAALSEQKYITFDGTVVDVETCAVPITYEDNDGALVFVRDISARKQVEDALRESEERYRRVIENMEDVFFRDEQRGEIVMASPSAAGILGIRLN